MVGLTSSLLPKIFPCHCKEKFMLHAYGVVCYMEVRSISLKKENELAFTLHRR